MTKRGGYRIKRSSKRNKRGGSGLFGGLADAQGQRPYSAPSPYAAQATTPRQYNSEGGVPPTAQSSWLSTLSGGILGGPAQPQGQQYGSQQGQVQGDYGSNGYNPGPPGMQNPPLDSNGNPVQMGGRRNRIRGGCWFGTTKKARRGRKRATRRRR